MSRWGEMVTALRRKRRWLGPLLLLPSVLAGGALLAACGSPVRVVDDPYDSCSAGDDCRGGLVCADTTLPASSGYSGSFCTSGCSSDADCLQLVSNFDAVCVNDQCYLTCPAGSQSCPYSQGCFTFGSNAGPISLCTP
jgi:hypothetical protein